MFDGMDDIEGVDPYQIKDLQSGMGGAPVQSVGVECPPALIAGCKPPNTFDHVNCQCVKEAAPSWVDRITGGVSAIGEALKIKSQADVAAQADKLRQLAQKGQITQQSYQQMQTLLQQRAQQLAQQPQQSFWDRNKTWIIVVSLAAVGGVAFYFWRKRR